MNPWCHNRPPFTGRWVRIGFRGLKGHYVYRPFEMSQSCEANTNPVAIVNNHPVTAPELSGWECRGCVWFVPFQEVA